MPRAPANACAPPMPGCERADHVELEARLGLEALHESVVVELAGLGEFGIAGLEAAAGVRPGSARIAGALDTRTLESPVDGTGTDDEAADLRRGCRARGRPGARDPDVGRRAAAGPAPGPARLGQLRRRFHELGAVNPFAVDEYAALRTRLETLEVQAADLSSAIQRTRDLIVELDTMIADRFRTTFAALETAFSTRFEQLFGGGFAKLSMTDPSDLGSTGIEIVARPPGKKAQALAMLSGGERALTAVALLFAMLEVRPVPFCVLDEVDAALDEANIGRFAEALRSLAHQTQFIVITHNRGTIEAADALYGVTVGDDSVSRVISLRLDEAQALARRDRGRRPRSGRPAMPFWRRRRDEPPDTRGRRTGRPGARRSRVGSPTRPTSAVLDDGTPVEPLPTDRSELLPLEPEPPSMLSIGIPTPVPIRAAARPRLRRNRSSPRPCPRQIRGGARTWPRADAGQLHVAASRRSSGPAPATDRRGTTSRRR